MTEQSDETRTHIARIADTAAKLLHEVKRLRSDILAIQGRLQPFDDERIATPSTHSYRQSAWKLVDAINMIAESRGIVEGVERDVRRIDSVIKGIEDDVVSRSEMKRYLGKNRPD